MTTFTVESKGSKVDPVERPGSLYREQGGGYHQCWYPVGLSRDLAVGDRFGTEFCDGRIVVYRGDDGVARAMTPYCAHMGSDLSVGDVMGNNLRCAFHHWEYGSDGVCAKIPSGDRIPRAARLFRFPVEERWGLIWVFLGTEPLYAVPSFPIEFDPESMLLHAFEVTFSEPLRVDPWVLTANTFDLVHNRVVHGISISDPEIDWTDHLISMDWEAQFVEKATGSWRTSIRVWATNGMSNAGTHDGRLTLQIVGGTPMGSRGSRYFFALATDRSPGAQEYLEESEALHTRLVNEDVPILNTSRLGNEHLVAADRAIARFLRHSRDYPRTTVARLEAQAVDVLHAVNE